MSRAWCSAAASAQTKTRSISAAYPASHARARSYSVAVASTSNAFADAGLVNDDLVRALDAMAITTPTEIQVKALDAVGGRGGNVFIASHTGSGKTLAYLLPVIQRLKQAEAEAGERLAKPKRPKVIVACPTLELA